MNNSLLANLVYW